MSWLLAERKQRKKKKRESGKNKEKVGCSSICKTKIAPDVMLLLKMAGETFNMNDQTHSKDQVRKFKNVLAENHPILNGY